MIVLLTESIVFVFPHIFPLLCLSSTRSYMKVSLNWSVIPLCPVWTLPRVTHRSQWSDTVPVSGKSIYICHSLTDSIISCHDLWPILSYFCVVAVNHYAKYGKTRAEEDARRYLDEKEQLEKEKEVIRKSLLSLRSEKRAVKEELKKATGERIDLLKCLLVTCHEGCHNLCSIWRHLLTISSAMGAVHLSWYVLYCVHQINSREPWSSIWPSWRKAAVRRKLSEWTWSCGSRRWRRNWRSLWLEESWGRLWKANPPLRYFIIDAAYAFPSD